MKTSIKYNRSRIMRNAWYMFKKNLCKSFAAALRKAWANERYNVLCALAEGRDLAAEDELAKKNTNNRTGFIDVPADYYGVYGRYYGD